MLEHFTTCLKKVNVLLNFLGLCFDSKDNNRTFIQKICNRKIFFAHFMSLNLEVAAEVGWLVDAVVSGKGFLEIVYFIPCAMLGFICNLKSLAVLYNARAINEFIDSIKILESMRLQIEEDNEVKKGLIKEHVLSLLNITRKVSYIIVAGLFMFATGPMFITLQRYHQTGETIRELPFYAKYPFDQFDGHIYPWIYLHQMFAATEAINMAYAPDCLFFTCCTFVNIHFLLLQYDMERVVSEKSERLDKVKFKRLALRHIELIRCVELLEDTFSTTILVNALTSSVIICATLFNALALTNFILIASFTSFFVYGVMQIYLYCYYGDCIERSSNYVSDAIYYSLWYNIDANDRKLFLIVMIRAQKPCQLTGRGFFAMNLIAFTSILSNSWSYFALLKTMYHPE